jgi:excinuclease ABC subunit B
MGRAARNVNGKAILYADRITDSMRRCLDETNRRRAIQIAHNEEHGIVPQTVQKSVQDIELTTRVADARAAKPMKVAEAATTYADEVDRDQLVRILEQEMNEAAAAMDFEKAALLRDQLFELRVKVGG